MTLKTSLLSIPFIRSIYQNLNNQYARDEFVKSQLRELKTGSTILDAGCGSQRYRQDCNHLNYRSQDFGQYSNDFKESLGTDLLGGREGYSYGQIDYLGNIWQIEERDETFDAILCTEVFEHIPYPNETIAEFSRLLKPNGVLILTAPSNCLRHMDPYFFYTGFTDRWCETILAKNYFLIANLEPVGDYYSWLAVELARAARYAGFFARLALLPAFIYFYCKKKTVASVNTLCMGYHIVAIKK